MAEFLPPDEMTLDAAGDALMTGLAEGGEPVQELDRTYLDTFDGLLHEDGLSAWWEAGRIVLSERGSGRALASDAGPRPTAPLMAQELPAGPLREVLAPVSGIRALLPLVRIQSRARALRVLDDERKTVVRMSLEQPSLVGSNGDRVALRPRLRLAGLRGYDPELRRVQHRLEHELGFRPADQPLVDEALRAAGRVPGGVSSKPEVALGYNQRSDEAAALVLQRLLEVVEANLEGAIDDVDTEFLHDLRVSVRRSRAVQRELSGVFPPAALAHFRAEFRWLQQITGDTRDLDVYLLEFGDFRAMVPPGMRSELGPLLEVLRAHRGAARSGMMAALRSERTAGLFAQWSQFLGSLPALAQGDRPDAARPIGAVAAVRIGKVYRKMLKMGRAIDDASEAEAYHELRKKGKELRYLLELFAAPLYPADVVKPMIKSLKSLQDVLGRHQDREVQVAALRSLRDEIAGRPDGAAALMAMGVLVERLGADERAARAEFAERFSAFSSGRQRRLVKETFV